MANNKQTAVLCETVKEIGILFSKRRVELNKSIRGLSKEINISDVTINNIEKGTAKNVTTGSLNIIAQALRLKVRYLIEPTD